MDASGDGAIAEDGQINLGVRTNGSQTVGARSMDRYVPSNSTNIAIAGDVAIANCSIESVDETETTSTTDCSVDDQNSRMLQFMVHYLDLVDCDELFLALCMVFDNRMNSMFHIVLGEFRENCNDKQPRLPYMVRMVLDYCHDKASGAKNQKKYDELELRLKSAKENFSTVRTFYGLKSYEEMEGTLPL